jgi:hypothetical protein
MEEAETDIGLGDIRSTNDASNGKQLYLLDKWSYHNLGPSQFADKGGLVMKPLTADLWVGAAA